MSKAWSNTGAQLTSVRYTKPDWALRSGRFPFTVPTIASLDTLDLDVPVVCFVGETWLRKIDAV